MMVEGDLLLTVWGENGVRRQQEKW